MNAKQQQQDEALGYTSKIPRFDPRKLVYGTYGEDDVIHRKTRLRKSTSNFNATDLQQPDILRSTSEHSFSDRGPRSPRQVIDKQVLQIDERRLKREGLSLSHLSSVLSDMDDDNASLDSLGILTPNQMKDFLEEDAIGDANIVEVIDINGHKIECKLHYEDMQWSSPFLNLSGGKELFEGATDLDQTLTEQLDFQLNDKEISSKVSEIIKSQENINEGGYAADSEADICINNQQIIDIIQKASGKQEKRGLQIKPLSESGYNADSESDVSLSPTEDKYPLLQKRGEGIQRESVTDSGFYSETRSSYIAESDFDDAPRGKTRSAQVIDGKLYCSNKNVTKKMKVAENEADNSVNVTVELSSQISVESKDSSSTVSKNGSNKTEAVSKVKSMVEDRSKVVAKTSNKGTVAKKGKWDSISAKIAASMAVDKKIVKKEVKSKIDTKGQVLALNTKPKNVSKVAPNGVQSSKISKGAVKNIRNLSSDSKEMANKRITLSVKQDAKSNQKENRPNSARSNHSDAPRQTSTSLQSKRVKTITKTKQENSEPKNASRVNLAGNSTNITKRHTSGVAKHTLHNPVATTAKKVNVKSGANTIALKNRKDCDGSDVTFDQPDVAVDEQFEKELNELKDEKEKVSVKNVELEVSLAKLNDLYEDERQKFCSQLTEMREEIQNVHIRYGEEAHKQSEQINRICKELERTTITFTDQSRIDSAKIERLQNELESVEKNRQKSEADLKESYEMKIVNIRQDQINQLAKMKNSQKLFQEIDSLKCVLDIKAEEMHSLRKKNMQMMKELEDYSSMKDEMRKMCAKIEELQEILNIKSDMERSLTMEHESLKQSVECETKVNKRLSMEIEELHWKLKQSDDLSYDSMPLSPGISQPHNKTPPAQSPSFSFYNMSPKSPSRRSLIVNVRSPRQTQTPFFTYCSPNDFNTSETSERNSISLHDSLLEESSTDVINLEETTRENLDNVTVVEDVELKLKNEPLITLDTFDNDRFKTLLDNNGDDSGTFCEQTVSIERTEIEVSSRTDFEESCAETTQDVVENHSSETKDADEVHNLLGSNPDDYLLLPNEETVINNQSEDDSSCQEVSKNSSVEGKRQCAMETSSHCSGSEMSSSCYCDCSGD